MVLGVLAVHPLVVVGLESILRHPASSFILNELQSNPLRDPRGGELIGLNRFELQVNSVDARWAFAA